MKHFAHTQSDAIPAEEDILADFVLHPSASDAEISAEPVSVEADHRIDQCKTAAFIDEDQHPAGAVASVQPATIDAPAGMACDVQDTVEPVATAVSAASDAHGVDSSPAHSAEISATPVSNQPPVCLPPAGFALFEDGVYQMSDADSADSIFVCSPLRVDALFADKDGRGNGRLISVKSAAGHWHAIPVVNADLLRRPTDVIATLVDHGLELATDKKAKDRLIGLLKAWKPTVHRQSVDRMGWVGDLHDAFALGSTLIGRSDVLPLSRQADINAVFAANGDIDGWKREVGIKCRANPMMILAASLAFSGPLLAPLGLSSGGLHFRGASSSGKTTLLRIAASVWGKSQLITQWRATSNGLEAIAATLNDMLLPLDEISARDLGESIYMLGNGTGKARMAKGSTAAVAARWRLALISSGEISVEKKLSEARLTAKTGHEVRLIDIEADSRSFGVFDVLHGSSDAAAFADCLQHAVTRFHGTVGPAFVRKLIESGFVDRADTLKDSIRANVAQWLAKLPGSPDGQIPRVAKRFAQIGLAGTIATHFDLTGWGQREAMQAAEQAFLDWYDWRFGARHEAVADYVTSLNAFLADRASDLVKTGAPNPNKADPVGWSDHCRIYLSPETWGALFGGAEGNKAAKALRDMQILIPGDGDHLARKSPRSIPGRPRLYTLDRARLLNFRKD